MSEENQINKEDLDKVQELLKKSAEDIAAKEAELQSANDKVTELEQTLGKKEQELSKLTEELESFRKEKQDAFLKSHIEVMKEAGKVNEETDIEALMDELRKLSEENLQREAELLKELAEANKKAVELSEKQPVRKTQMSKGTSANDIDLKRKEVYKALGAEDLLEGEDKPNDGEEDDSSDE